MAIIIIIKESLHEGLHVYLSLLSQTGCCATRQDVPQGLLLYHRRRRHLQRVLPYYPGPDLIRAFFVTIISKKGFLEEALWVIFLSVLSYYINQSYRITLPFPSFRQKASCCKFSSNFVSSRFSILQSLRNASSSRSELKSTSLLIFVGECSPLRRRSLRFKFNATFAFWPKAQILVAEIQHFSVSSNLSLI